MNDALAAASGRLANVIGDEPARRLREFQNLAEAVLAERVAARPWVSIEQIAEFLNFKIGYSPVELFYAFYFDPGGCLIDSESVAQGTANSTQVSARDLIVRAVEFGSSSLLVAHNHPSGVARPSVIDLEFTSKIDRMAEDFEMRLIDHLIVARGKACSIRRNALISLEQRQR
ncbi:MAG: JAB domain-containing protein [Sphingomicrobium sp.]